jgi:DNA-binding LytR/AlgR family response regulator
MILFKDENDKDKFSLLSTNIHFIETEDNYVMVHYNEGEQLKKKMLRNTLKNIEIQLKDFPIKRCHRSFMVNIQNLESAVNNRKRLQLKLKSHDRLIPVSKNYSSIFWNLLSQA